MSALPSAFLPNLLERRVPDPSSVSSSAALRPMFEQRIRFSCQQVMVLFALDHAGLFEPNRSTSEPSIPQSVIDKALRAASALNLTPEEDLYDGESDKKHRIKALLRHQMSYFLGLSRGNLIGQSGGQQASTDPEEYGDYLRGVFETHRGHATYLAQSSQLGSSRVLVDIGCGLGAFSSAWIGSSPQRTTQMLDLSAVLPIIRNSPEFLANPSDRVDLRSIDLSTSFGLPANGEVYLLSNVLHLFDDWKRILRLVADAVPVGKHLAVLEATPNDTPEAKLFDLMLHIRGGGHGSLVDMHEVVETLGSNWSSTINELGIDPFDFFGREYRLLTCLRLS